MKYTKAVAFLGFVLAGGANRHEVVVGRDAVEQRGQHVVRHVAHQPDVIVLQDRKKAFRPAHIFSGPLRLFL